MHLCVCVYMGFFFCLYVCVHGAAGTDNSVANNLDAAPPVGPHVALDVLIFNLPHLSS